MIKQFILLTILLTTMTGLISYQITYALFSDTASSNNNTFSAAEEFPVTAPLTSPQPGDIVINEVFPHGGNSNDWFEILNKTGFSIDVSGWAITDNVSTDTFPTVPVIPPGGYGVIVASPSAVLGSIPGSAVIIQLTNSTIGGSGLAVAGDRLMLAAPDVGIVDAMNWGSDPSTFTPGLATPSAGNSLKRSPNGTDTDSTPDWTFDETPSIGVSND